MSHIQCPSPVLYKQWRRNEFESGGAHVRAQSLSTFWLNKYNNSRFDWRFLYGQYNSLVNFLFAAFLLTVPDIRTCPGAYEVGAPA